MAVKILRFLVPAMYEEKTALEAAVDIIVKHRVSTAELRTRLGAKKTEPPSEKFWSPSDTGYFIPGGYEIKSARLFMR